ncbi:1858_t:CDS:2 [Funneliformis mosseae]|uniref:1858_t:CDS:1 n=1 Tax=Funneliformis mosseae TaxID=27381 RepID=A0A9N9BUT2_FUNMO|nr:1858_t:CDS:2 [Funneliformis mosseae]
MAEWTDPEIRTLIDERRTRNDEFHNLRRNRERFWGSIASKINQENGSLFNGHQCKEKFSNLVRNYNAMCNFISDKSKTRSQTGARYFDEFRTHFWERPEDEFDRVCGINTFNRRRSRGSGNITLTPSTREVEHKLRSSERRLSRSQSPIS